MRRRASVSRGDWVTGHWTPTADTTPGDGPAAPDPPPSTQAANLARMGRRSRGGGRWWHWRWSRTDRATLAARSRAQREAVRCGWDPVALRAALDAFQPDEKLF